MNYLYAGAARAVYPRLAMSLANPAMFPSPEPECVCARLKKYIYKKREGSIEVDSRFCVGPFQLEGRPQVAVILKHSTEQDEDPSDPMTPRAV